MLKCCGCQTNFILSLGGSFLFSKNFLPTPSLTGGLVMPIRRTKISTISKMGYSAYFVFNAYLVFYYIPKSDICSSSGSSPQHLSSFIRSMMVLDTLQRRCKSFRDVNGRSSRSATIASATVSPKESIAKMAVIKHHL